uniref:Putative secreted protein n=1 Tax=Anopheles darlingi TaxID=43151 RepID=A0A2M4DDY1_ANODA
MHLGTCRVLALLLLFGLPLTVQVQCLTVPPNEPIEEHTDECETQGRNVDVVPEQLLIVQLAVASLTAFFRPHQTRTVDDPTIDDRSGNEREQANHHEDQSLGERFVLLRDTAIVYQQITDPAGRTEAVDDTGDDGEEVESEGTALNARTRH